MFRCRKEGWIRLVLLLACLLLPMMVLGGCAGKDPLQDKAQRFLKQALAAPSQAFVEMEAQQLTPATQPQYDEQVGRAIKALGEGLVAEEGLTPSGRSLYQSLLLFHSQAAHEGIRYEVQDIKLTKASGTSYDYQANMKAGDAAVQLTGVIQFDAQGMIDYLTILP